MNSEILRKYAKLAVVSGANVQPGQLLVISSSVTDWQFTEYCVEELCIRADCQGRGYGRKFFSLIEDKLKERDVHTIFLMTDRDMPAYGFYRRIGFTELPELTALYREF